MVEIEGRGNEELRKYLALAIEEEDPVNTGIGGYAAAAEFLWKMTGA